jgi:hypothetical protein
VNIISYSLKSNQTGNQYLTSAEFSALFTDPALWQLYTGLLYQQVKNANNGAGLTIAGKNVASLFTTLNLGGLRTYITNLMSQGANLQTAYNQLRTDKLNAKADLTADYIAVFSAVTSMLQSATTTTLIDPAFVCPPTVTNVVNLTSSVLEIAHDIQVKNYNAVVVGTLKFISDAAQDVLPNDQGLQDFCSALVKYGSFAANVVLAKDADDVKQAINSFALPAGSASIKKNSYFNVSLNAYVGFGWGLKNNPKVSSYTTKSSTGADSTVALTGHPSIGVYAPVGFDLSWGHVFGDKNPCSISLFVSVIDVGALVGYRFITDTGQLSNSFKVSLSNILAPGANLAIGLPNMPLTIGGGLQWVPTLQRDPQSNTLYNINYSGVRWQVFLALDLPLLNLHTSSKSMLSVKLK